MTHDQESISLRPELLRSIAAGNGPIDEDWPLHAFWDRWNVPGGGERFMEEVLTPDVCVAMMKSIGLPDELAENNTWVVPGGKEITLALYRSATNVGREWGPDLRRVVVPSMLIWGARDLIVPIEFGRRMATRMGAEVVPLDAGHFWPAERPEEAAHHLRRHWDRAESSPQTILTQGAQEFQVSPQR